jgi:monoamine oxidase
VRVAGPGGEEEADRVVLAVPARVIGRVDFHPPLPPRLRAAYDAVEVGHAAKLFVPLTAPAPPSAVLSVPERYWTWTAKGAAGVQPVVHAFAGSPAALARLEVERGPEAWLASLARLRPDLALDPAGAVLSTWDDDPWAAAAYSSRTPPVSAWAPAGPFHACGEHTAGPLAGLMEGALASGLRAADEVAGALARASRRLPPES